MDTTQIYTLVNDVAEQALGNEAIKAIDTSTLVSLGDTILNSQNNTEAFLNTLAQRIGRTIFSYRVYENNLRDMVLNDFEYGAILQKIKISMPDAEEDESYDLTNGVSVDHYKVNKPEVDQKLFVTRTPYQFHITVQRATLKEAFLNESQLSGFISYVFGEVRNRIEFALENLGLACIGNFISLSTHEVKLITNYNAATSKMLTAADAVFDEQFMRYAVSQIKQTSKMLRSMSSYYNDGTETRHTPLADQRLRVLSSFQTALETVVEYAAFNQDYIRLNGFSEVNYWQDIQTPDQIDVTNKTGNVKKSGIVAVLHDRDALGIYQIDEDILTTPVNAAGRYYNTYWHERQLWFNDLSENFVYFTLT